MKRKKNNEPLGLTAKGTTERQKGRLHYTSYTRQRARTRRESVVHWCKGTMPRLIRTNKTPMPKQSAPMTGRAWLSSCLKILKGRA